jgi:cellulose synthase/poly-beta-1,6-N-acetylglucosamine synthase-like glycosyltransferase
MGAALIELLTSPGGRAAAVALHLLGVAGTAIYALGQLQLWWWYRRRGPTPPPAPCDPAHDAALPVVTVQVPMYNERHVAAQVIDACARLDWPRDRFELQLLDDSTDATCGIVDARAAYWRAQGVDVVVLRRAERTGYKAGALAAAFGRAKGEFHALFDADFCPEPDFLRRVMPSFADPEVGAVQARWGHLNREASAFTRAQSLILDAFFCVEQEARARAGLWVRFNGAGGVWRAAAVADAGGWQADTLSEDYDLCLRAQLGGWRIAYRRDVVAPAEIPPTMADYKVQQTRWARGRGQVIRKLAGRIVRARVPFTVKAHALFDMFNIAVVPAVLLVAVVSPWYTVVERAHPGGLPLVNNLGFAAGVLSFALIPTFAIPSLRQYARDAWGWARESVRTVPAFLALTLGINLVVLTGVIAGLLGASARFERTAKFSDPGDHRTVRGSPYRRLRVPPVTLAEGATAAFFAAALALDLTVGSPMWLPFHTFLVLGFGATFSRSVLRR